MFFMSIFLRITHHLITGNDTMIMPNEGLVKSPLFAPTPVKVNEGFRDGL